MIKVDRNRVPVSDETLRVFQDIAELVAHEQQSHDQSPCPEMPTMIANAWESLSARRQIIILTAIQTSLIDKATKVAYLVREISCG
jgi:hypothetical protein